MAAGGKEEPDELDLLLAEGKEQSIKEKVVKGSNLWEKQNVIINGERIVKVARVAQQLAKLVAELIQDGVPIHGAVCISEYLHWAKDLCDLSDSFVSSKMVGVGIKFRVDSKNTAIVKEIVQGGPAEDTDILVGDELSEIDGKSVYRIDFQVRFPEVWEIVLCTVPLLVLREAEPQQDMADILLGRQGTSVTVVFKRPDVPHPVRATMRRQGEERTRVQCDRLPAEILNRVRFLETSLMSLRFEIEEWGVKKPLMRLTELKWHQSVVENEAMKINHRCLRLSKDLGLDVGIARTLESEYSREHIVKDPFSQMVWRGYFSGRRCTKMREWIAAVQNELRNLGFKLLTTQQTSFAAALIGIRVDDCVSAVDIQSFIDRWLPPCRWGEVDSFAWPERGHGFVDALKLAEVNLLDDGGNMPMWFYPHLPFQESTHLLTTADPGTFVVRYSATPGCFAVQWTSVGRQVKSAKVFCRRGGYSWREKTGPLVYPVLSAMLHEVHSFLAHGIALPPQRPDAILAVLGPDDD